jgi:hypothetical protein
VVNVNCPEGEERLGWTLAIIEHDIANIAPIGLENQFMLV